MNVNPLFLKMFKQILLETLSLILVLPDIKEHKGYIDLEQ